RSHAERSDDAGGKRRKSDVVTLVRVEATRQRDHELPSQRAGNELACVAGHGGGRKTGNLTIGDPSDGIDLVGEPAEPRAEHDRRRRRRTVEPRRDDIGRHASFACPETAHAARSAAMSADTDCTKRMRSSHGKNALAKPFSAISHSSLK